MSEFDFLNVDLDAAIDPVTLPTGEEVRLQIIKVTMKPENHLAQLLCRVVDKENIRLINHPLWYPKDEDNADQENQSLCRLRDFFNAVDIPHSAFQANPDVLVGVEFWVILKEEPDKGYGPQNSIKRIVNPKDAKDSF